MTNRIRGISIFLTAALLLFTKQSVEVNEIYNCSYLKRVHVTYYEWETAKLECPTCDSKSNNTWIINGKESGEKGNIYEKEKLQMWNAGSYTCIANDNKGSRNHTYYIVVKRPTIVDILNEPENATIEVGKSHSIKCKTANEEQVSITWHKDIDLRTIPESSNDYLVDIYGTENQFTLKLKNLTHNDEGWYSCLIKDTKDDSRKSNASVYLKVVDPPIRMYAEPANATIEVGKSHNITCKPNKTDNISITWYKNLSLQTTSQMLPEYHEVEINDAEDKFTLELQNLVHNDEGWYSCLIEATTGDRLKSNASVYLKVVDPLVRKPWYFDTLTITLAVILVLFSVIAAITIIFILYRYKRKEDKLDMEMAKATVLTQCIIKKIVIEKDKHIKDDSMNIPRVKIETCSNCDNHAVRKDSFSTVVYELPPDDEYEFPLEQLKLGQIIGHGEFGEVFKAEAYGILQANITTVVAVKMLKEDHKECDVKALVTEMEIMKIIGKHDNIINLLGCCSTNGKLRVITEYAANGNLRDYLRTYNAPISSESSYAQSKIEKDKLLNFAHQIADGMAFLASKKCIHRDLAARNILVTEHYRMKIADFGLARDVHDVEYYKNVTSECKLPLKWMPPESIFYKKFTTQSDVWSYGILLWEIMTMGGVPYPTIKMDNFYNYLKEGNRLERPPDCPTKVYEIMCNCWSDDANDRPNFSEIIKMLENVLTDDTNQLNSRVSSMRFSWELPEFNGSSDVEDERDKLLAFTQDTFKPAITDMSHHWMSKHDFIFNSNEVLCM